MHMLREYHIDSDDTSDAYDQDNKCHRGKVTVQFNFTGFTSHQVTGRRLYRLKYHLPTSFRQLKPGQAR
jgi:hypothetical protein